MSEAVFLSKLADILQVNEIALNEQFRLDNDNWDSLMVVATIAAIDEEFDTTVPAKELTECASVGDLLELIRHHQKK